MTKAGALTTLIALWFGFFLFWATYLAFERPAYFELVNAAVVAMAIGIQVGFGRGAWRTAHTEPGKQTSGQVLILGIFIVWFGIALAFLCLWSYRLIRSTESLDVLPGWVLQFLFKLGDIDGWPAALSRWIILVGGVLHLAASGAIDGKVPARAYIRAGVTVGLAVAAALFLISFGIV